MKDDNIDFVARHYRRGAFSAKAGWRRLGIRPVYSIYKKIAAAVAVTVVLSATAAFVYHNYAVDRRNVPADVAEPVQPQYVVRAIDFDDAPLPVVVAEIKKVYGVEVGNMPEDAESYRLSLHYEGNAVDLVATINELLDTNMTIAE